MPDQQGTDDNKTTKSVVNKKQKQMLNQGYIPEEGYDVARDEGRVKPSKDKKDATTMPVSDEVKKTQKKSKGKSAFELVKSKYGKAVMDTKKEELDLTQVAEAFGGYIVEEPKKPKPGSYQFSRELGPKGKYKTSNIVKRMMQSFPLPGEGGKIGSAADAEVEKQITAARADKKAAQIVGRDALTDKITGGSKPRQPRQTSRPGQQTIPGMEGLTDGSKTGKKRRRNRRRYLANPGQLQLDLTNPKDRKQIRQDVAAVAKNPVKKAVIPAIKGTGRGVGAIFKNIKRDPITTAVAAGIARDSFRMPQLPPMPKVSGGKVGRRTAG